MKKYVIFSLFFLAGLVSYAIPAKNVTRNITLSNGSTVSAKLVGDEYGHYWLATDGTAYREVSEDLYEEFNPAYLNEVRESKMQLSNARRLNKSPLHALAEQHKYEGDKKGIVILVNFSDLSMKATSTRQAFDDQFNKEGYNKNNHVGSVHDYFYDQSYGALNLTFDVVGPFKVSKKYSYYGANDRNGDDLYPQEMVVEACKMAAESGTDFSKYDWDGDGEVDQVYIIYAGYGEHAGASANTIWPHEWELSATKSSITLSGVHINTYACSCELTGTSGSKMSGMGTACHEFSHCMGLPDFYDTSYSGGFGMNAWDLMDSGSYNGPSNDGEVPCGYTAYERWMSGWLTPTELKEPCYVKDVPNLEDSPEAYIIYNDGNRNEYFLLENRQPKKWYKYVDRYTGISGMLACHVDYSATAWNQNTINNSANHQRMTIIASGKSYGTYYSQYGMYSPSQDQYKAMLFPGSKNVTTLDNTSHVKYGGKLFNMNTDKTYNMNKPITDIAVNNGLLSFTFNGGEDPTAVREVIQRPSHPNVYDISGRRVSSATSKGLYIINGKKVLR